MGITGVNGDLKNYASYYSSKAKNDVKAKNENIDDLKGKDTESNKTSATASTKNEDNTVPKTRTAAEYTRQLQEQFSYMNKNTTMEGVPTTVSVSPAFIAKCANDPEKAKFLEENLAALPGCAKIGVAMCTGTLTNLSYNFDANGNISVLISGSTDPDGKIAKAHAERKARENKEKAEKLEENMENKRTEDRKAAEKLTEQLTEKLRLTENTESNKTGAGETFTVSDTYVFSVEAFNAGRNLNRYC